MEEHFNLLFARYAARAKRIKTKPVVVMVSRNEFWLSRSKKSKLGQSGVKVSKLGLTLIWLHLLKKRQKFVKYRMLMCVFSNDHC